MKNLLLSMLLLVAYLNTCAQCSALTCFSSLNVSLDETARAKLHPDMLVFGDHSACSLQIAVFDADGNELLPFDSSVIADCDILGDFVVRVRDVVSLTACWSSLNISDMLGVCGSTSTQDINDPEPYYSAGVLHLGFFAGTSAEIAVYDLSGRKIYRIESKHNEETMDLSLLPSRQVYVVCLKSGEKIRTMTVAVH